MFLPIKIFANVREHRLLRSGCFLCSC